MTVDAEALVKRALAGGKFMRAEIISLLRAEGQAATALFAAADRVRAEVFGSGVDLRALIEFSNYCRRNCLYCGLRRDNHVLTRYRMKSEVILGAALHAVMQGFGTVVLQSGEDPWWQPALLAELVRAIKDLGVNVTLSVGELAREEYDLVRRAGAERYLLRHETADQRLFAFLKPDTSLARRIQCLTWLKDLGFQTGAGCMVGLPGQTIASLSDDVLLMSSLQLVMAGIGPFVPHSATPLAGAGAAAGSSFLALKTLAITRLCLPSANLPATTAFGARGRDVALNCGANVVMANVTPWHYRSLYAIYPGKAASDPRVDLISYWQGRFRSLGRSLVQG